MSMTMKDTMNPDLHRKKDLFLVRVRQLFEAAAKKMMNDGKTLASERLRNPGTYLENFWYGVETVGDNVILKFGNYHHAATIIEEGTKRGYPIPTVPTGVKFFKEGRWIRKAQIIHPGLPARHIVRDSFQKNRDILVQQLKTVLET